MHHNTYTSELLSFKHPLGMLCLGVALAILLAMSPPVFANHVCQTEFLLLKTAIGATEFANPVDQTRLLYKVDEALWKTHLGKYADAEQKLTDISSKVKALRDALKPKIFDDSTTPENEIEVILARIDEALLCIPNGTVALPH